MAGTSRRFAGWSRAARPVRLGLPRTSAESISLIASPRNHRNQKPGPPAGIRSRALLESAVGRQWTSLNGGLKYPHPVDNAATLLFGICCDHPFHNGNNRTALVAMLVHLDRNQHTLFNTSQNELYDLMIDVAGHTLSTRSAKREKAKDKAR